MQNAQCHAKIHYMQQKYYCGQTGDLLHRAAQDKPLGLHIAFVKNATTDLFNKGKHGKISSN